MTSKGFGEGEPEHRAGNTPTPEPLLSQHHGQARSVQEYQLCPRGVGTWTLFRESAWSRPATGHSAAGPQYGDTTLVLSLGLQGPSCLLGPSHGAGRRLGGISAPTTLACSWRWACRRCPAVRVYQAQVWLGSPGTALASGDRHLTAEGSRGTRDPEEGWGPGPPST